MLSIFNRKQKGPNPKQFLDAGAALDAGVALKRSGALEDAKALYYRAIELDPNRLTSYYSLAKTCYLLRQRDEAVLNYLTAAHLFVLGIAAQLKAGGFQSSMIQMQIKQLPTEVLALGGQYGLHTPMLFLDTNIRLHVGHALVDLEPRLVKPKLAMQIIEKYKRSLSGEKQIPALPEEDEFEKREYYSVGLWFLIENIQWQRMDIPPASIYVSAASLNYGSLRLFCSPG